MDSGAKTMVVVLRLDAMDGASQALRTALEAARLCAAPLVIRGPRMDEHVPPMAREDMATWRREADSLARQAGVSIGWQQRMAQGRAVDDDPPGDDTAVLVVSRRSPAGSSVDHLGVLERTIVGARRPVLVLPSGTPVRLQGASVVIAWDDSAACRRAVREAAPLLAGARRITLVSVERYRGDRGAALSAQALREELGDDQTPVDIESIGGVEVPHISDALLQAARRRQADLVVMGAYGHPRLEERWLGGVTRSMLRESEIALLVCH